MLGSFQQPDGLRLCQQCFPSLKILSSPYVGCSKTVSGETLTIAFKAHDGLPLIFPMSNDSIECVRAQNKEARSLESSVPRSSQTMLVGMSRSGARACFMTITTFCDLKMSATDVINQLVALK